MRTLFCVSELTEIFVCDLSIDENVPTRICRAHRVYSEHIINDFHVRSATPTGKFILTHFFSVFCVFFKQFKMSE